MLKPYHVGSLPGAGVAGGDLPGCDVVKIRKMVFFWLPVTKMVIGHLPLGQLPLG